MRSRNPTGWMIVAAVALAVGGAVSPNPHALAVGGALAAGCLAVAGVLAWDSRQRRLGRIDAARSTLPPHVAPDESFARRRIED